MKTFKILAITSLFLGLLSLSACGTSTATETPSDDSTEPSTVTIEDHSKGNLASTIELVEYSDFQCPACGAYYPIVKELVENLGGDIKFTYKHFPLRQHLNAQPAARATEAAGLQGKFWEMHDMIFENQRTWSAKRKIDEVFEGYATDLGLDLEQFKADYKSKAVKNKIANDTDEALDAGVNSTPSFYVNGTKIPNPKNYDEFETLLQSLIVNS